MTERSQIVTGDALSVLRRISDNYIDCCVTSPPYYDLRDYGIDGQIGLERTVDEYIYNLVGVFREVRRTLRPDGTLWINIADTYSQSRRMGGICKEERAMPHSLPPHAGTAERRLVCEAGHYLEQTERHAGERERPLH